MQAIETKYYCLEHGHTNIVIDQARPATCKQVGLSQGSHCADCNAIIEEQIIAPIKEHDYGEDIQGKIINQFQDEHCTILVVALCLQEGITA